VLASDDDDDDGDVDNDDDNEGVGINSVLLDHRKDSKLFGVLPPSNTVAAGEQSPIKSPSDLSDLVGSV